MTGALDLLESGHLEREAHDHLTRECPWYRHVGKGGRDHPDLHCRPAPGEGGALVKFTPRTPEASTVVKPTVPPGGPGLFRMEGHHLPPYIEHLYPHLVARYGKHDAYGVAVGIVKKWAAGVNPGGWKTKSGKGKRTHPDVRAAAARNVAQWEEERAEAHARHGHSSAEPGLGLAVATAPGARPFLLPAPPGGRYSQYGMYQNPVQAISPSPPLPPAVSLPTAAEVKAVIPLVPECSQRDLSDTAKKFLEQAAWKLNKDNPLEALAVMRSAQAAMYAAHKADLGNMLPSAYTANVFTKIPAGEQSSATTAMKQGTAKVLAWRKAEQALGALSDRIRKRYFHGVFSGPSQLARFTEDDMTALDRVLALAVVTGHDVSEPTESDTSAATPLIQPDETLLDITEPKAAGELASMAVLDRAKFSAFMTRARATRRTQPYTASQFALRAALTAREAGAHHLARHVYQHVQALAAGGNVTHPASSAAAMQAGGRTVTPRVYAPAGSDNPNGPWKLTAVGRLELAVAAGKSAGTSAGSSVARTTSAAVSSAATAARGAVKKKPDAHQLHVLHEEHLHHEHVAHEEHEEHLENDPAAAKAAQSGAKAKKVATVKKAAPATARKA